MLVYRRVALLPTDVFGSPQLQRGLLGLSAFVRPTMKVDVNPGSDSLSAPPIAEECNHRDCDDQIRRILDSPLFSSSRRLSDFLLFAANAAKEGRTEVDQYEVAEQVLHRDGDFNPLDDASVRKLASQVRHKLEDYYRTEGATDTILVSLPRRSYVLRFRLRTASAAPEPSTLQSSAPELESEPASSSVEIPAVPESASEPIGSPAPTLSPTVGSAASPNSPASLNSAVSSLGQPAPRTETLPASSTGERAAIAVAFSARGWLIAGLVATACLLLGFWIGSMRTKDAPSGDIGVSGAVAYPFAIKSEKGDLRGPGSDLLPGAVLAAPVLRGNGDTTVRMSFLPQHATQQAGLLLIQDDDNFVRLGSHFKIRSMLEVGHERDGTYAMWQSAYRYDPLGQSGLPLWLSLRRDGDTFQGYVSRDGAHWESYGPPQQFQPNGKTFMGGIYAFNGRTNIPASTARFSAPTTGIRFHHRPDGPFNPEQFPGWRVTGNCADKTLSSISGQALEVRVPTDQLCGYGLRHELAAPASRNWSFTIHLDFLSSAGSSAGLVVRGPKSALRLVRRDLNGGSIMLERNVDMDVRVPDFPGTPPVYLRLAAQDGVIRGSFSRDGLHFELIPSEIPESEIGGSVISFGGELELSHWLQPGPRPPARFLALEQDMNQLQSIPR